MFSDQHLAFQVCIPPLHWVLVWLTGTNRGTTAYAARELINLPNQHQGPRAFLLFFPPYCEVVGYLRRSRAEQGKGEGNACLDAHQSCSPYILQQPPRAHKHTPHPEKVPSLHCNVCRGALHTHIWSFAHCTHIPGHKCNIGKTLHVHYTHNVHRHLSVLKLTPLPAATQTSTVYSNMLTHTHTLSLRHTQSAPGWHRESKQGRWVRNDGCSLAEQVSTPRCLSFTHPALSAQSQPATHTHTTHTVNQSYVRTQCIASLWGRQVKKQCLGIITWTATSNRTVVAAKIKS